MSLKIAGLSLVYNEENLVEGCVRSLEDVVDQHVMLVSEKPYFGEKQKMDRSADIAEDLGCTVVHGEWDLDHSQRNTGIHMLYDYDWIIATDVDMWIQRSELEKLLERLHETDADALTISQRAYWFDVDHTLVGDDFQPVIAIRPHVRFSHIGNIDHPYEKIDDIKIDHINWCKPKDILKKVKTYSHAPEFNIDVDKWYQDCFLNWEEGQKAKMPDEKEFDVMVQPLHEELRNYLPF